MNAAKKPDPYAVNLLVREVENFVWQQEVARRAAEAKARGEAPAVIPEFATQVVERERSRLTVSLIQR